MISRISLLKPKKPKLFLIRRVTGESMAPTLRPGAIVVAIASRDAAIGDVVIFSHQGLEKIKRIYKVRDGKIFLVGDNSVQSTDSRDFGWLDKSTVMYRLVWPRVSHRKD